MSELFPGASELRRAEVLLWCQAIGIVTSTATQLKRRLTRNGFTATTDEIRLAMRTLCRLGWYSETRRGRFEYVPIYARSKK